MADEEKNEVGENLATEAEAPPKKGKKGLFLGAGAFALVATAAAVSMMAMPGDAKTPVFNGPFVMDIAALGDGESLTANLAGEGGRRYLVIDLKVEYDAYDEAYGLSRIADPLYIAKLQDMLLTIASQRSADDVLERGTQEIFLSELRQAAEALLFPVHVSSASSPILADPDSGLRAGLAVHESTMRLPYEEGTLHVDGLKRTVRLGQGEEYTFKGDEQNLLVKDEEGRTAFIDVTGLKEEFVGDLKIGIKGRIRELYKVKFIVQ